MSSTHSAGRLQKLERSNHNGKPYAVAEVFYAPSGMATRVEHANGMLDQIAPDVMGRPQRTSGAVLLE